MPKEKGENGLRVPSYSLFSRERINSVFSISSKESDSKPFEILKASINTKDEETIRNLIEVLGSEWLNRFAAIDSVTLTMIRPLTREHTKTGITSEEFEQRVIETAVFHGFSLVFETSMAVPETFWEEFYRDQKEKLLNIPPALDFSTEVVDGKVSNRWEQMIKMHSSGPVQFLILLDRKLSPTGHSAVEHWRSLMGNHYDPARALPGSLRAIHAKDYYNNLIHGSDSKNSVIREINLVTKLLRSLVY